ncbi:MAG: rnr [Chthoniobacteraceae bacterium]|nr:rnr [Chthoniobacteraceae bacterium]
MPNSLRTAIQQLLGRPDYQPMDKVELSKALGFDSDQRSELRKELKRLEQEGLITRIRKNRYILPETADLVTGILQFHHGGNAHLLNEKKGEPDVFVSQSNAGTAMNGDRVVVRLMIEGIKQRVEGGRIEGRVVRILEQANDTIVGTLQQTKKFFYVIPDDARFPQDVYVRPAGPSLPRPPQIGDKVVVKLDPWENRHVNPEGEIIELLGPATDPGIDMLSIIRKYHLEQEFPEAVVREAEQISEQIDADEIARREDLRGKMIITIDPDDAKDFDDAIDVERTASGGWKLGVHIADVSHYVRPGTLLDKEARARGNSTYLADRVIPMLPERLSNGVCSLKPQVDRLTTSAFIEFDKTGKIKSARFARSVIHSAARFTYRQAFAVLNNLPVPPTPNYERGGKVHLSSKPVPLEVTPELRERLHTAWELASLLRKNRFGQGSLDLDFPEVKVWLDDEGRAVRLEKLENDISHQLIEECMLAANEVVAREIKNKRVPGIYRIHDDPDPERLAEFREFAAAYGFKAGDLTQRREVQKLLEAIKGRAEEYPVKIAFLKSLKRAAYGVEPLGHYGLSKVNYTHFTSPIRRYADLVVHRVLSGVNSHIRDLGATAEHISKTERTSADAEKDSTMLKKMEFFLRQLSARKLEEFRAVVIDVRSYGLFVELPDVLVTGLVHVSSLPEDFYAFDSVRLSFSGRRTGRRFQLGDLLQVIVCRVDAYKRQIDFTIVDHPEEPAKRPIRTETREPRSGKEKRREKPVRLSRKKEGKLIGKNGGRKPGRR